MTIHSFNLWASDFILWWGESQQIAAFSRSDDDVGLNEDTPCPRQLAWRTACCDQGIFRRPRFRKSSLP